MRRSVCGDLSPEDRYAFWRHIQTLPEYKDHPALQSTDLDYLSKLHPFSIHIDGAEIYKNTEYMYWSISFPFATGDIFDRKIPLCCVRMSQVVDKRKMDAKVLR